MLPAQYRMTRSEDFGLAVSRGVRVSQPSLVVHALRSESLRSDDSVDADPKIGLVVSKSVGNAVLRHRVSRRLRHVSRGILTDLDRGDRLVIRALPKSAAAPSAQLDRELRAALRKARR